MKRRKFPVTLPGAMRARQDAVAAVGQVGKNSMHTGSREFAAYAQTLRRMHFAKLLERSAAAMAASRQRPDVYDILFASPQVEPCLTGEPVRPRS
jgi:hypothetical protein